MFKRGGSPSKEIISPFPYPVDRKTYDQSIELLRKAINKTKLGIREKNEAMSRLNKLVKL